MITSIILAAGKGKRMNSKLKNKVVMNFAGKPLIIYAVELMKKVSDNQIVVVGSFAESVKEVLKKYLVNYAYQKKRLGTGHAVKVALNVIKEKNLSPSLILVGYGDHMMFYKEKTIKRFINNHLKNKAAMSLVTVNYNNPDELAWGRIIRDEKTGYVIDSVEQKDADLKQRKIKELNAGFYCFDYQILRKFISKIPKSRASGEYYLNSLVKILADRGYKVLVFPVVFEEIGIGVNKKEELEKSEKLYTLLLKQTPNPKS